MDDGGGVGGKKKQFLSQPSFHLLCIPATHAENAWIPLLMVVFRVQNLRHLSDWRCPEFGMVLGQDPTPAGTLN